MGTNSPKYVYIDVLGRRKRLEVGKDIPRKYVEQMLKSRNAHRRHVTKAIDSGNWVEGVRLVASHERLLLVERLWNRIPATEHAAVLAEALSLGEAPIKVRSFLYDVLTALREANDRVFDGDAARTAYDELPLTVTIYRGTVKAECDSKCYGVCWTLDAACAAWFASEHGRFRNTRSPPVILKATIPKGDICGLLSDRQESEVLVVPSDAWMIKCSLARVRLRVSQVTLERAPVAADAGAHLPVVLARDREPNAGPEARKATGSPVAALDAAEPIREST